MSDMKHTCHYPGCEKEVPPKMWGCKEHWFRLPKQLRDAVWSTYRPGQEIDKNPSSEYLSVANQVQLWCHGFEHGWRHLAKELEAKIPEIAETLKAHMEQK